MRFRRVFGIHVLFLGLLFLSPLLADSIDVVRGEGLEIQTTPSMAEVYLNGIIKGTTPLVFTALPVAVSDLFL